MTETLDLPAAEGRFGDLARDIIAFGGWRLAGLSVLTVLAALAEGAGLLLLIPILSLAGIAGPRTAVTVPVGLGGALGLYVGLVAAAALVLAARGSTVAAFRFAYVDDLRRRLHRGVSALEWRVFLRLRGAHLVQILTDDTVRTGQGVEFLLRLAGWAVEIPVLLAVALRLSPAMTGASLLLAGVCLVVVRPLNRRARALGRALGEAARALYGDLVDTVAGMRIVRSLGLEEERDRRFGTRMASVRSAQLHQERITGLARAMLRTLAAAVAALAVWMAIQLFDMPLADTLVLMAAFARLLTALLGVQDAWRMVLHALPAFGEVRALLTRCRAAAEPALSASEPMPTLSAGVRFEAVTFRYTTDRPPALTDITAELPARAVTAVVGPSGAGKSTLVDLLLGLAEPDQGRILVDGRPLQGGLRRTWRRRVGYVPQDAFLFHDTIRANLTVAAPEADDRALWAVLERVAAADFVRALPAGLDTVVGDRGGSFSGGQRQRLALARALLPGPALLILDEATSALDAESERQVLATLEALRSTLSVVVVAHRPSTVRGADHMIVLAAGGTLAAAGPRAEVERTAAALLARLDLAGGDGVPESGAVFD